MVHCSFMLLPGYPAGYQNRPHLGSLRQDLDASAGVVILKIGFQWSPSFFEVIEALHIHLIVLGGLA